LPATNPTRPAALEGSNRLSELVGNFGGAVPLPNQPWIADLDTSSAVPPHQYRQRHLPSLVSIPNPPRCQVSPITHAGHKKTLFGRR
jgi:hypothetical protein